MNGQYDPLRQNLCQQIDEALNQRGVVQEIILLRALNKAIAHFATTEADWRAAQPLEYRSWREQIRKALDALTFMIASADSYAQEPTQLAGAVARATSQLREIEQRLHALTSQQTTLLADLNRTQAEATTLQREVELLEALKALIPFREAVKGQIGEQRLRALADSDLGCHQTRHRERIESLAREVADRIGEIEDLLKQDLTLTEQEWAALRQAATQIEPGIPIHES